MIGNHALECQIRQTTIRRIEPNGDAALARSLAENYQALDIGYVADENASLSENHSGERSAYFVMERETDIVGGAGIPPLPNDLGHIAELQQFVLNSMSADIGDGVRAVKHCLQVADLMGYRACHAESFSGESDLNEILRLAGFKIFGKPLLRAATLGSDAIHYMKVVLR
jgi:putative acetyltransferase